MKKKKKKCDNNFLNKLFERDYSDAQAEAIQKANSSILDYVFKYFGFHIEK